MAQCYEGDGREEVLKPALCYLCAKALHQRFAGQETKDCKCQCHLEVFFANTESKNELHTKNLY